MYPLYDGSFDSQIFRYGVCLNIIDLKSEQLKVVNVIRLYLTRD